MTVSWLFIFVLLMSWKCWQELFSQAKRKTRLPALMLRRSKWNVLILFSFLLYDGRDFADSSRRVKIAAVCTVRSYQSLGSPQSILQKIQSIGDEFEDFHDTAANLAKAWGVKEQFEDGRVTKKKRLVDKLCEDERLVCWEAVQSRCFSCYSWQNLCTIKTAVSQFTCSGIDVQCLATVNSDVLGWQWTAQICCSAGWTL